MSGNKVRTKTRKIARYLLNGKLYRNLFHNLVTYRRFKKSPIVLGGSPRSGTTLLMSILDAHPEIHVIPFETAVLNFRPTERRLFRNEHPHFWFCRLQVKAYLFATRLKTTANRWCEKTPRNILNVEEIIRMYAGNVKIINIYRDGRDVVASRHGTLGYIATPELWRQSVLAARKAEGAPFFLSVRYEDLIRDPKESLERIRSFLQLEAPFNLDSWIDRTSVKAGTSLLTGKYMPYELRNISSTSIGNWTKSESPYVKEFLASRELMELNRSLGYEG
jgi:hypothetical protein